MREDIYDGKLEFKLFIVPKHDADSSNAASSDGQRFALKLRGLPKDDKVRRFWVVASTRRTDYMTG